MKMMSRNLTIFIIVSIPFNVFMQYGVNTFSAERQAALSWMFGIVFPLLHLIAGVILGYRDNLTRLYLGFRYHFIWFASFNGIWLLWIISGLADNNGGWPAAQQLSVVVSKIIGWGYGLIAHFLVTVLYRRKFIKGMHKQDLFE